MKISRILMTTLALCYLTMNPSSFAMDFIPTVNSNNTKDNGIDFTNLIKVNDDLYVLPDKENNDLYFVMERYTGDYRDWTTYEADQISYGKIKTPEIKQETKYQSLLEERSKLNEEITIADDELEKLESLATPREESIGQEIKNLNAEIVSKRETVKKITQELSKMASKYTIANGALMCFNKGFIVNSSPSTGEQNKSEVWIAYAISQDSPPSAPYTKDKFHNVEMAMMVQTAEGIPFISHMGIARAYAYEGRVHGRIANKLHGMSALVMSIIHPDKQYMITVPEQTRIGQKSMETLLAEAIPLSSIFVGDNVNNSSKYSYAIFRGGNAAQGGNSCAWEGDATWRIQESDKIIFELDANGIKRNKWFFCHPCLQSITGIEELHYVVVKLGALIDLLRK